MSVEEFRRLATQPLTIKGSYKTPGYSKTEPRAVPELHHQQWSIHRLCKVWFQFHPKNPR